MPDGITLEDAALTTAKSEKNTLVVAGPGAGKTELLAQRAAFLLQTGKCSAPYRILAISFKRDAAENLKERVLLRCGRDLARRLDSLTYEAFAKDIVDRFRMSLPQSLRPSRDYQLVTGGDVAPDRLHAAFLALANEVCSLSEHHRQAVSPAELVSGMIGSPLPASAWPKDLKHIAATAMWASMIGAEPSKLMFTMVSRLAEFIVRENASVRAALRDTYRFVFLDEFQDTTTLQCELTETCFLGSGSVLTAVGDTKQRIMGWAGALPGIFERFRGNFGAEVAELTRNHRSRSRLVEIQSVFAAELGPNSGAVVSSRNDDATGECRVLEFADHQGEAAYLANLIADLIEDENVPPEQICVLCRAQPGPFASALVDAIKEKGVKVIVDVNRRETLGEPVSTLLLNMLELILSDSAATAWQHVSAIASELAGDDDDDAATKTRRRLMTFLSEQRGKMPEEDASKEDILVLFNACVDFVGREQFAVRHPQYAQGDYLNDVMESLAGLIEAELERTVWDDVVDAVRGIGAVSIMTMHKSKGLEFDTVIFLGLEDNSLWGYQRNRNEETCGLFVALSRAKERCVFTFCRKRLDRRGNEQSQTRITIRRIYELFKQSGVEVERIS